MMSVAVLPKGSERMLAIPTLETHEVIKGSGKCVNAGSTIPYEAGTISIMQAGVPHEVTANSEGLYLFAKFMPALC